MLLNVRTSLIALNNAGPKRRTLIIRYSSIRVGKERGGVAAEHHKPVGDACFLGNGTPALCH